MDQDPLPPNIIMTLIFPQGLWTSPLSHKLLPDIYSDQKHMILIFKATTLMRISIITEMN